MASWERIARARACSSSSSRTLICPSAGLYTETERERGEREERERKERGKREREERGRIERGKRERERERNI